MPTRTDPPLEAALPLFRAAMPGVDGVVLASADGHALAHDLATGAEAGRVAHAAVTIHHEACGEAPLSRPEAGASVFVPREGGLLLVVFVPDAATPPGAEAGAAAVA